MNAIQLNSFADKLCSERPLWVNEGSLGGDDTQFLFRIAFHARANAVVEIGTASGYSTSVLCRALKCASDAELIGTDFKVVSYDILSCFYGEPTKLVGDAARETLSADLLRHVTFRNPATTADLWRFHEANSIPFLFIDADHRHPAPTADLLRALPYLAPRATVVLHDINLPALCPENPDCGVKVLFDALDVPNKETSFSPNPNIGSFVLPEDKTVIERQLRSILSVRPWQTPISDHNIQEYIGCVRRDEFCELQTRILKSSPPSSEEYIISVRVCYRAATADSVVLVWGLDEFTFVPVVLPPGSFVTLDGSHINTPMKRDADSFILEFTFEPNRRLDYAFSVTRRVNGQAVDIWCGANAAGDYYSAPLVFRHSSEAAPDPSTFLKRA